MLINSSRSSIPPSRSLVCDILRYDRVVPTFSHDRIFNVRALCDARSQCAARISWPALFLKAYGVVSQTTPRLQQTWMNYPLPHLYQQQKSVGVLVVKREFADDEWLFWAHLHNLEQRSLTGIQAEIDGFQHKPVELIFRRQLWLAQQPTIVRRFFWWLTFHVSGRKKCKRLGTFFLSTVSGQGTEIQHLPSVLTSGFTYGPIDEQGKTRVTVTYDHRIMDGHHVADVLADLESVLHGQVLNELRQLPKRFAA